MTKLGRNEQCPCGSGRKYKKCCLPLGVTATGYTVRDRESAQAKLGAYIDHSDWEDLEIAAEEIFWRGDDNRDLLRDESVATMSEFVFDTWLFFDYELEPGRCLADELMEESGWELSHGERAYLATMKNTTMRAYEVTDVTPGRSLTLREPPDGPTTTVRERSASRQLHRFDLVAARIVTRGASGHAELDGGLLTFAPFVRERLLEEAADIANDAELLPPLFHSAWLASLAPPRLVNYDGDSVVLARAVFDVSEPDALVRALDDEAALERDEDSERWDWAGCGTSRDEPVIYGWFELSRERERLELHTNSRERAERGRTLVQRAAGDAVRYRTTVLTDPARATDDLDDKERPSNPPVAAVREALEEASRQAERDHHERWFDEPVPALGGHTPREAATSESLRPRLGQLLKESLGMYERALAAGAPVADPTWMWEELGLPAEGIWSDPTPPRLGHESFTAQVDGSRELIEQIAARTRASTREHPERVIPRGELFTDLGVQQLLRAHIGDDLREHCDAKTRACEHGLLAQWVELLCNLELFRRKTFWVGDELAWLLGATRIDVNGDALELPFASFALVFTDRYSLGLAERLIAREPDARLRGRLLRCLTVYVTRAGGTNVRIALSCDALDGGWPFLFVRDVGLAPNMSLDEIVSAARPDADAGGVSTLADCASIEQLLRLVFNAILYATSAEVLTEPVEPPRPAPSRARTKHVFTSETVFRLPGKIDITAVRELKRARRGAHSAEVVRRCLVRGHWRRANPSWKDQRARWIAPHWRGPSVAALVEREYRLC